VEEGASVAAPAQVDAWVGLDVGKSEHVADVLDNDGGTAVRPLAVTGRTRRKQVHWLDAAFYDRKRAEGKRRNAALICLARRRRDVILAMLRTGQPYQPARPAPSLAEAA
jgi:hypothetical protein